MNYLNFVLVTQMIMFFKKSDYIHNLQILRINLQSKRNRCPPPPGDSLIGFKSS